MAEVNFQATTTCLRRYDKYYNMGYISQYIPDGSTITLGGQIQIGDYSLSLGYSIDGDKNAAVQISVGKSQTRDFDTLEKVKSIGISQMSVSGFVSVMSAPDVYSLNGKTTSYG